MTPERGELFDHRLNLLEENHSEMKQVLKEVSTALNKLVLIDERQVQAALSIDRLSNRLDKYDERLAAEYLKVESALKTMGQRVGALESLMPIQRQTSQWVLELMRALAIVSLMFAAKRTGLM